MVPERLRVGWMCCRSSDGARWTYLETQSRSPRSCLSLSKSDEGEAMVHDLSGYREKRPRMMISAQSGWAPKQAQVCLAERSGHGFYDTCGAIMKGRGG